MGFHILTVLTSKDKTAIKQAVLSTLDKTVCLNAVLSFYFTAPYLFFYKNAFTGLFTVFVKSILFYRAHFTMFRFYSAFTDFLQILPH
jgi:hypothetical protein